MYDRRPTSRAARGTLTDAAPTPVVCGSCQLAILTPLRGRRARSLKQLSWKPERTSSETRQTTVCLNGCSCLRKSRVIADYQKRCDSAGHDEGPETDGPCRCDDVRRGSSHGRFSAAAHR